MSSAASTTDSTPSPAPRRRFMPSGSALGGLAERLAAIGSAGEDGVAAADSSPPPGEPGVLVHSPSTEVGNAGLPTGGELLSLPLLPSGWFLGVGPGGELPLPVGSRQVCRLGWGRQLQCRCWRVVSSCRMLHVVLGTGCHGGWTYGHAQGQRAAG